MRGSDLTIERWSHEEGIPAYDALRKASSRVLTIDQVRAMLAAKPALQTIYNLDRAEAFRQAEASLRLEGLDPTTDAHYVATKARVLAGELTIAEGKAEILAHHRQRSAASPSE